MALVASLSFPKYGREKLAGRSETAGRIIGEAWRADYQVGAFSIPRMKIAPARHSFSIQL